jgi:hypothetical protein
MSPSNTLKLVALLQLQLQRQLPLLLRGLRQRHGRDQHRIRAPEEGGTLAAATPQRVGCPDGTCCPQQLVKVIAATPRLIFAPPATRFAIVFGEVDPPLHGGTRLRGQALPWVAHQAVRRKFVDARS